MGAEYMQLKNNVRRILVEPVGKQGLGGKKKLRCVDGVLGNFWTLCCRNWRIMG